MAHLTSAFPAGLSYGSTRSPVYKTSVVSAYSGVEERNQAWQYPLHIFNVDLANRSQSELETLVEYYHAAAGRHNSFNFKDPGEYKSCSLPDTPANSDQTLHTATGGETTVQVVKNYTVGGQTRERKVTRPISGTLLVAVDSSPVTSGSGDYTVDYDTGVITFTTGLATGAVVSAGYEFYTPARFDTDNLDVAIQTANCDNSLLGSISCEVVEIRE